ncbi:MAG: UDP-4-amino-4,6-dideoxy-N-acetyl-beta-L-altrosamine transaminase [Planctomycetes bacterium]|nr:UDP-4-amino-4,6-dideoxy-N-acetyl-beta-L-altrosamine transaminase [Planctomycetota bacterium]
MIPYGRQDITEADIEAVVQVLRSDFLTQGPTIPAFENAVCKYVGAKHGIAVNSATSALHIACMSVGLGPGDWLWTSPNTFVASANCGRYCGADIDFVDIDPLTLNMSVELLKDKLAIAEKRGTLPKVVVPVHFAGEPCEMEAIWALAKKYNFRVIEDASHAIGASYAGKPIGNCAFSDITVFSFHPVKIITTAEGGLATTNCEQLAARMSRLRTHGITRDPASMTHASEGGWYYQQVELGYNYRMTDLQAALGLSQMSRLNQYIEMRHRLAQRYEHLLGRLPVKLPFRSSSSRSALHLYPIQVLDQVKRKPVFDHLRTSGIGVNVHYIPVHTQPDFRLRVPKETQCANAVEYYQKAISLPMYATLSDIEQDKVARELEVALV